MVIEFPEYSHLTNTVISLIWVTVRCVQLLRLGFRQQGASPSPALERDARMLSMIDRQLEESREHVHLADLK